MTVPLTLVESFKLSELSLLSLQQFVTKVQVFILWCTGSQGGFLLWVPALVSHGFLNSPLCLSSCGGGGLPCVLLLEIQEGLLSFQFVEDSVTASKLFMLHKESETSFLTLIFKPCSALFFVPYDWKYFKWYIWPNHSNDAKYVSLLLIC